jgi:hypothetical protein
MRLNYVSNIAGLTHALTDIFDKKSGHQLLMAASKNNRVIII